MPRIRCSISRCQQACVKGSCQIFFKCQSPPRYSTSQSASHMAAAWYFIYLYSTLSKKDLRQGGVQQTFVEWLQATLSSQIFLPFFHNKQNHHNVVTFFFFFWPHGLWDLSSRPGIEPRPRQWKPGILTTRPPGNSQYCYFFKAFNHPSLAPMIF